MVSKRFFLSWIFFLLGVGLTIFVIATTPKPEVVEKEVIETTEAQRVVSLDNPR